VPIIGTSPDSIDLAEDRERFQQLIEKLGPAQPPNRTARTPRKRRCALAREIGYPAGGAAELRARRPRDGDRVQRGRPARYMRER
jgi:hypothetical protein